MKGLILAAGAGRRLSHLSTDTPKVLLEVGGETILERSLAALSAAGIMDVSIVVGHHSSLIERKTVNGSRWGIDLAYLNNTEYRTTNNIYSLHLARDALYGEEMILLNGDVIFSQEILEKIMANRQDIALAIDTSKKLGGEEMKVSLNGEGMITAISKELDPKDSDGEYIGILKLSPTGSTMFFNSVQAVIDGVGRKVFYEAALQDLTERHHQLWSSDTNKEVWIEVDTEEDYNRARKLFG